MGSLTRQVAPGLALLAAFITILACSHGNRPITYRGGVVTPDQLAGWLAFRDLAQDPGDRAEVEEMLEVLTLAEAARARGIDSATAAGLANVEEGILIKNLRRHLTAAVVVDPAEVEAIYQRNPHAFRKQEKMRLRNLFKRFPPDPSQDQIAALSQTMADFHAQLTAGADFAELAKRESDSETRYRGGMIGNVVPAQLPPEIAAVAGELEPGAISQIIKTADGLTILKCEKIVAANEPTPEWVRERIAANLRGGRSNWRWQQLETELPSQAAMTHDLPALRDANTPATATVVRFNTGQLSRAEVVARLGSAQRGAPDLATIDGKELAKQVKGLVFRILAAERARQLGLVSPEVENTILWSRRRLLATTELRHQVAARLAAPSPAEVRAYYAAHRTTFLAPEQFRFSVIRIDIVAEDELLEVSRRAARLAYQLQTGAVGFKDVVAAHSDHRSAKSGGDLGWLTRRELAGLGPGPFNAAMQLEPGQVSRAERDGSSYWIIRLEELRRPRVLSFEEAAAEAEDRLGSDRTAEIQATIKKELRATLAVRPR